MFRLDLGKYSTKGGFLSPTLAAILYQTALGDFVYQTDSNGNVVLDNQGTLTSAYDGLPYSGRGIELGALNDVDMPIHHTLGSDIPRTNASIQLSGATNSSTKISNSEFNIIINEADVAYRPIVSFEGVFDTTATYKVVFSVVINSGAIFLNQYNRVSNSADSIDFNELVSTTKTFTMEAKLDNGTALGVRLLFDSTQSVPCDVNVVVNSIQQITNPNSHLTYYDFTDGLVTLGNSVDGGSSKELITNGTFDTDTIWVKESGWSISGGKASCISSNRLYQSAVVSPSKTYQVSFDITDYTSGALSCYLGNEGYGTVFVNSVGTHVFTQTLSAVANTNIYFDGYPGATTFVGSIDNISVKEILPISTKYTLNTKTVNNVLTHTTPWNASDWARINNNPNLIGKLAVETLGATKTIPELDMVMDAGASADSYYMCSEKSGAYLVDSRVAYGAEILSGTYNITGNDNLGVVESPSGVFVCDGTNTVTSYIVDSTAPMTMYGEKVVSLITISGYVSGTVQVYYNNITNVSGIINANGEYGFIGKVLSGGNDSYIVTVSADFVGTISLLSAKQLTAQEISNYASTARTNADLQQKGIQQTAFVTDGAGTPLSYTSNILNYDANSYTNTQWNPSLESAFWLEEIVDGVVYQHKYDGTNLTTYTDNVAGTPTAHSPENANYLSGKGVYPKITADPYTSYQCKYFSVHNGSQYTSYDQTTRYTILSAM